MSGKTHLRWYLDLNGAAVGPFTIAELIKKIISHEITIKHGVSLDRTNWKSFCNEELFDQEISSRIRELNQMATQYSNPQGTSGTTVAPDESEFFNSSKLMQGISIQLEHAKQLTEISVEMNALRKLQVDVAANRKLVAVVKDSNQPLSRAIDENEIYHLDTPSPQRKKADRKKLYAILAGVALIAIGQLTIQAITAKRARDELAQALTTKQLAQKAKLAGDYEKALQAYQSLKDDKYLDAASLLEMAEIHLQKQNFSQSRDLCQKALLSATAANDQSRAHSCLGFVAIRENNLELASTELQESLKGSTHLFSNLHNLGLVFLNRNMPEKAEPVLLKALEVASQSTEPTLLALFEVALALDSKEPETLPRLKKIEAQLKVRSEQDSIYRAKFLVARALAASAQKNMITAEEVAQQFVAVDPKKGPKPYLAYDLDLSRTGWNTVKTWCRKVYDSSPASVTFKAFMSRCLLNNSSPGEALVLAREASEARPQDQTLRLLYAEAQMASSNWTEARDTLRLAETNPKSLELWNQICVELKEVTCAHKPNPELNGRLPSGARPNQPGAGAAKGVGALNRIGNSMPPKRPK